MVQKFTDKRYPDVVIAKVPSMPLKLLVFKGPHSGASISFGTLIDVFEIQPDETLEQAGKRYFDELATSERDLPGQEPTELAVAGGPEEVEQPPPETSGEAFEVPIGKNKKLSDLVPKEEIMTADDVIDLYQRAKSAKSKDRAALMKQVQSMRNQLETLRREASTLVDRLIS